MFHDPQVDERLDVPFDRDIAETHVADERLAGVPGAEDGVATPLVDDVAAVHTAGFHGLMAAPTADFY
ncbi:MAG: hypothetical protein AB9869_22945 [Verrucomicrobiia bacterium]